jgi:hypothetical protein
MLYGNKTSAEPNMFQRMRNADKKRNVQHINRQLGHGNLDWILHKPYANTGNKYRVQKYKQYIHRRYGY